MRIISCLIIYVFIISLSGCKSSSSGKIDLVSYCRKNMKEKKLCTGWYHVLEKDDENGFLRKHEGTGDVYSVNPCPVIIAKNIISTSVSGESPYPELDMQFDETGTQIWSNATKKAIGKHLVFILDNVLISAPMVHNQIISGRSSVTGSAYSAEDYGKMKKVIDKESKK